MGATPGQPLPDMSPVKDEDSRTNGIDRHIMSSSPPPMDAAMAGSPSKPARSSQVPNSSSSAAKSQSQSQRLNALAPRENGVSFDRSTRSFSNGAAEAVSGNGATRQVPHIPPPNDDEDDEDADGGFDLAKGFAPIAGGSFHSQRSGSLGVRH
jgi:forkhead protein FKH